MGVIYLFNRLRIPPTIPFEIPPPPSPAQAATPQRHDDVINSAMQTVNRASSQTAQLPPLKKAVNNDIYSPVGMTGQASGPVGPVTRAKSAPGTC